MSSGQVSQCCLDKSNPKNERKVILKMTQTYDLFRLSIAQNIMTQSEMSLTGIRVLGHCLFDAFECLENKVLCCIIALGKLLW
jgi:hypothetical protein